jgi:fatty acid desaturase
MSHLFASLLCVAGFAALAFAMHRHQRDLVGRSLPRSWTRILRVAGGCALLAALGVLVGRYGWALGLVMFSGHTSLGAGIVLGGLISYARRTSVARPR